MRYIASLVFCAFLGVLAAPGSADAQPYRAREGVQNGQVRSLDQILNGVRRDRPGNLADVDGPTFGPGGDARYRLKWVSPDGRVQWLDTDARTGRVLGVEGENRGRQDFGRPRGNFAAPDGGGAPNPRDGRRGGFNRGGDGGERFQRGTGGGFRGNAGGFGGFQRGGPRPGGGDGRRGRFGR